MGVSLERVQFKFASIIGELCSEPDVLSQFAVWLDLRLAEYKLKGAISLDCSGEEPDPIWLKGLNKSHKKGMDSANQQIDRRIPGSSPTHSREPVTIRSGPLSPAGDRGLSHGQEMTDIPQQHSPDIVVIKDEPSDIHVYPISLHSHSNTNSQFSKAHKRTAAESFSNSNDHWSQDSSPQGIKRERGLSKADSPSNQSLMSVIGVSDNLQTPSIKGDNSVLASTSVPVMSSPMAARSSVDFQGDLSADYSDISLNNSQFLQGTSLETDASSVLADYGASCYSSYGTSVANIYLGPGNTPQPLYYRPRMEEIKKRRKIQDRIPNAKEIPKTTVKNITTAVRTMERWLEEGPPKENRHLFDIPPEELDNYLAEFYQTIKTPVGAEYKLQSKLCLRSNIDRYLKDNSYPESIRTSAAFPKSQKSYKMWTKASKQTN